MFRKYSEFCDAQSRFGDVRFCVLEKKGKVETLERKQSKSAVRSLFSCFSSFLETFYILMLYFPRLSLKVHHPLSLSIDDSFNHMATFCLLVIAAWKILRNFLKPIVRQTRKVSDFISLSSNVSMGVPHSPSQSLPFMPMGGYNQSLLSLADSLRSTLSYSYAPSQSTSL